MKSNPASSAVTAPRKRTPLEEATDLIFSAREILRWMGKVDGELPTDEEILAVDVDLTAWLRRHGR